MKYDDTDFLEKTYERVDPAVEPDMAAAVKRLQYVRDHIEDFGPEVFTRAVVDVWRESKAPCKDLGVSQQAVLDELLAGTPDRREAAARLIAGCGVLPNASGAVGMHALAAGFTVTTDLSKPWFKYQQVGAVLPDVDLSNLDLRGAQFENADLHGADLTGSTLREALLKGATLNKARLVDSDLSEADMREVTMFDTQADFADFSKASLNSASLGYGNFHGARFVGTDLSHANLSLADLSSADFSDANLTGADLNDAVVTGAIFNNTNVAGAIFSGTDVTDEQLAKVKGKPVRG